MSSAHAEGPAFFLFSSVPILNQIPPHVVMTACILGAVGLGSSLARTQLTQVMNTAGGGLIPESRLTYRNAFEILAEKLFALSESILGYDAALSHYPMVACLFTFILFANLLGLVPGLMPATEDMNTTTALGVFVFLYYNVAGLREHGLGYLKHFCGPILWLAPLMLVIELASHLFRPLSLSLRLRGNILGDHIVLGVFSNLIPYFVPVIFYALGIFVAFIQSFVFCLMTMVYISLSTSHDH